MKQMRTCIASTWLAASLVLPVCAAPMTASFDLQRPTCPRYSNFSMARS